MKEERSRVLGSSNQARGNKDGERKDERGFGLADTKVCQGHTKVLRIGKLLLLIHTRLCVHS